MVLDSTGAAVTMIVTRYGMGAGSLVGLSPDSTMRHTVLFPPSAAGGVIEAIRKAAA